VIVAEDDSGVIGFASLSAYRPRPAYSTTAEDSIYVAGSHRGAGIGKSLLSELVGLGGALGFHSIVRGSSAITRLPSRSTARAASNSSASSAKSAASSGSGSTSR